MCTQDVVDEHSLTDLSSLFAVAGEITLGAPPEFEDPHPFGIAGFADIYDATSRSSSRWHRLTSRTRCRAGRSTAATSSPPTRRSPPTGSSPSRTTRTSVPNEAVAAARPVRGRDAGAHRALDARQRRRSTPRRSPAWSPRSSPTPKAPTSSPRNGWHRSTDVEQITGNLWWPGLVQRDGPGHRPFTGLPDANPDIT